MTTTNTHKEYSNNTHSDCILSKLSPDCIQQNDIFSNKLKRLQDLFPKIPNKQTEIKVFEMAKEFSDYKDFMLEGCKKSVQLNRIFVCIEDTKTREKVLNRIEKFVYQEMINDVSQSLLSNGRRGRKRLSETFFKGCELSIEVPLQRLI